MQCRDVRELLDSFVGEELLVETNHDLLRHIETCPECRAELQSRRTVRASLHRAFKASGALAMRPEFAAEVSASLRQTGARSPAAVNPWRIPLRWALAASVLIGVAVGVWSFRKQVSDLARNAVGDHLNCAVQFRLTEKPVSLEEAASRYDPAFGRLRTVPPDEVATAGGRLQAVDRHSCAFEGRRYAHVVYKLDGHLVSVLLTADDSAPPPAGLPAVPLKVLPRIDGLDVASFPLGGHTGFVVSDVDATQFDQVATALATPLYRDLTAAREYSALLK